MRFWRLLTCALLLAVHPNARADDTYYDGPGGYHLVRRADGSWVVTWGGVIFPMCVKAGEPGPHGPTVSRFKYPSMFQSPVVPPNPGTIRGLNGPLLDPAKAVVEVRLADADALLWAEGAPTETHGKVRYVRTKALAPGNIYELRLRAAYRVGGELVIEVRNLDVVAGSSQVVTFDGSNIVARSKLPGAEKESLTSSKR